MDKTKERRYRYSLLSLGGIACSVLCVEAPGIAQVVEDGTLGTSVFESSINQFEITGGTAAGNNLFHSFDQFSIPESGSATFINDSAAVQTVFGRVTGSAFSDINGAIKSGGTSPNFDLYLLNPNGIVFGPSAALDLGGSFFATTASGVQFGERGSFHTVADEGDSPSLLTVAPSALFFQAMDQSTGSVGSPGTIEVLGSVLSVPEEESLALIAGGTQVDPNAGNQLFLGGALVGAPGGQVILGALGENGRVDINAGNSLSFIDDYAHSDIELRASLVDASGTANFGEGRVQISGRFVEASDFSEIYVHNYSGNLGRGGVEVIAETLTLDDSVIQAISYGSASGGDVVLDLSRGVGQLSLMDRSIISTETIASGLGGDLQVDAQDIRLSLGSGLGTETQGAGNAGRLTLNTKTLDLDEAFISANTFGVGDGGQITISAAERIDLSNFSAIQALADDFNPSTGSFTTNVGDAGDIQIETAQMTVSAASKVSTSTLGDAGIGGDINILASHLNIENPDSALSSTVEFGSLSRGGDISVESDVLKLSEGGTITASTRFSNGSAGNIFILNSGRVEILGESVLTGFFAQVGDPFVEASGATGEGGNISIEDTKELRLVGTGAKVSASTADFGLGGLVNIEASNVLVQDGAQIQAATQGLAPGGDIRVSAEFIELAGVSERDNKPSALVTSTIGDAPAGNINIATQEIIVDKGARLSASSQGGGSSGSIVINSDRQVRLIGTGPTNSSGLFVEATGAGEAGNIFVATPLLLLEQGQILASTASDDGGSISLRVPGTVILRDQAQISATAGTQSGAGNGGNVDIETTFVVARPGEDSDIVANAFTGQGGNIQISAQEVFGIEPRAAVAGNGTNDIDASSEYGENGVVEISRPEIEETLESTLPTSVLDASGWIAQSCGTADDAVANQFVVTGRGGLAMSPETIPSAGSTFVDLGSGGESRSLVGERERREEIEREVAIAPPLIESRDWHKNEAGEVVLTAPTAYQSQHPTCATS